MPGCEPVENTEPAQNTEPVQNTWQLKSVEVLLWISVDSGLAMAFWGSGCCIGVAFSFVLCSILWVLKFPQLCEVVESLEREGSLPGWWQTKGKGCFYNTGNKPPLNPERLL